MSDSSFSIVVDGRQLVAPAGSVLLDVLRSAGFVVPALCHDPRVSANGACGLCLVARVDRGGALVLACETRIEKGLVVDTTGPVVAAARSQRLAAVLAAHPLDCPACGRHGDCRLEDLVHLQGVAAYAPLAPAGRANRDESWPVIVHDPSRCIACGLCVRLCDQVMGVGAIMLARTPDGDRVLPASGEVLACEFCGQCVDACPVAALVARPWVPGVPASQRESIATTCSGCSCGCQLGVESYQGRLLRIHGRIGSDPDGGNLCVRGRFAWDLLGAPDRLAAPLIRRGGRLVEASWDEAMATTAQALRAATIQGLPVAAIGSTRLTDEDAYVVQRFMRSVVGSPHVDAGPDAGVHALVDGMGVAVGVPRSTATFADLEVADAVLVLRGDPARSHPMVKNLLVAGVGRGQTVFSFHAMARGLACRSAEHVQVAPGGEGALLAWLAQRALERGSLPADLAARAGYRVWRDGLEALDGATLSRAAGVSLAALRGVDAALRGARSLVIVVVTGRGIPGDEAGVARQSCELLAAFGLGPRAGSGVLLLGAKANAQGTVAAGLHPRLLPGFRDAASAEDRAACALRWGRSVAAGPGWSHRESMARAAAGEVGVLLLAGQDPVGTWPRGLAARAGVEGARFVVVLDSFLTETARLADVVFPVATGIERTGHVTSADGVRRILRRSAHPPGDLPSDRQVIGELARRLGVALPAGSELGDALERELGQPVPAGQSCCFGPLPAIAEAGPHRGFLLDAAPRLVHASSMTRHSPTLLGLRPLVNVRLSPADARGLGLEDGETARVVAGSREVLRRVVVDPSVPRGVVVSGWSGVGGGAGALFLDDAWPVLVEIRKSP